MPDNELPKNMGKKIADALKKQNEEIETENTSSVIEEQTYTQDYQPADDYGNGDNYGNGEAYNNDEMSFDINTDENPDYTPVFKVDTSEIDENPELKLSIDTDDDSEEFEMPNNINVLKRLIGQLPTGVSRQVGAQIIRQTIEALGIPMKSVLQDAQRVRDCLNSSIKDCNYTIQEYRSNIKNLEKQSASYQKQLNKLNDIIGLFVYNEKK